MAETTINRKKRTLTTTNFLESGKLPPQARDLEEAVLGALLLEKDAINIVAEVLKADSFYDPKHQNIYNAILALWQNGSAVDILTVTQQLKKEGTLDISGGAYYVTSLTNRVASSANIEYHARIIAQKFLQRELIRISGEITTDAFEDSTDAFELLDKAERKLFEVSQGNIKKDYRGIRSVVNDAIAEIDSLRGKEGGLTGIPSGFLRLDRVTSGFQKSDLVIIAARPGMGKTAFVLSVARNACLSNTETPRAVAVFSLEMSSRQLVTRMISAEAEIESEKLKKGTLEEHEWQQLNTKIAKLSDAPIFIDDTPAISVFELRAKCRRLKQQNNIQMIIVDYLQLMRGDDANNKNGNREQEVSYISRSLKALAKELDVPVLALAQLSRQSEKRGAGSTPGTSTGRPILSDLRESGSIEQDADMVMFIYRPDYYKLTEWDDGTPCKDEAEIMIAKHRNGELDNVRLRFIGKYTKFTDKTDFDNFSTPDYNPSGNNNNGTITISSSINWDSDVEDDLNSSTSFDSEAPF
ncbi:MAG: replicative DNA helicase [Bacteroidota bacterium]